ncbi:MAG: hypothetical protein GC182_24160 [Rhodopseudomonas sp.]|nr:hypothetical protein [Rhodopseudomonas sp.]
MIRKLTIALGSAAVLAAAALAPTAASAAPYGHHHGHHGWYGYGYPVGFYGPAYYGASNCYVVRRVVFTPYGKRWRRVTVCD